MTERADPISSQSRLLLVASSYELLDDEETKWSMETKGAERQGISRGRIHQLFERLRNQIGLMLASGLDPREINRQIKVSVKDLSGVLKEFSTRRVPYQQQKRSVEEKVDLFDEDVGQASLHFASFSDDSFSMQEDWRGAMLTQTAAGDVFESSFSSLDRAPSRSVDMKEKKKELAQCIRMSTDPESPFGAEPCIAHHAKGLSEEDVRELGREAPQMMAGKVLTELAAVPTVINASLKAVASGMVKACVMGSLAEGLAEGDPAHFHERLEETWSAFKGENPEFNKAMSEMGAETKEAALELVKGCVMAAAAGGLAQEDPVHFRERWGEMSQAFEGKDSPFNQALSQWGSESAGYLGGLLQQGRDYTGQLDLAAQETFYTAPGSIQTGIHETVKLGTAVAAGWALGKGVQAVRSAFSQGPAQVSQAVETAVETSLEDVVAAKAVETLRVKPSLPPAKITMGESSSQTFPSLQSVFAAEEHPFFVGNAPATAENIEAVLSRKMIADGISRKMAIAEKKEAAWANFAQGLRSEQAWLPYINTYPTLKLPEQFPRTVNQLLSDCQPHPFILTKLGADGIGRLKGNLLYKQVDSKALFLVQYRIASHHIQSKFGITYLIESSNLKWHERLEYTLWAIAECAEKKGIKGIYVAWDPSSLPLATVLSDSSQSILGMSSLSTGVGQEPLLIAKVALR